VIRTSSHLPLFLFMLLAAALATSGCGPAGGQPIKITNRAADTSSQWSEDLFSFALENLNHLEDNDCEEMLRSTQQRFVAMEQPEAAAGTLPPDALLASWPEPDMLRQVVGRLNQWVDTQEKPAEWTPDPMLATMSADFRKLPMVESLGQVHYTAYDGYMLMEAVWLRDVARSQWAGGTTADELDVARKLFDWTVRNIQTDPDGPGHVPQVPWETLFLGHGTAWEQAWTYILSLRQRGIDAALLALPDSAASPAAASGKEPLEPWCVGVLIGDKKKLYLFDFTLGLPIPGPGGVAADKSGQLQVFPAALDQVAADRKLLERLSLKGGRPYWACTADVKRAVALVDASPLYLEPRAKRIESRLTGERRLVLNAEPSQQAARFKAAGVGEVRIWDLPYTTLQRRLGMSHRAVSERLWGYVPFMSTPAAPLYKGRIMQLKGRFFNEKEAIAYYQKARPRNDAVREARAKIFNECYKAIAAQQEERVGKLTAAQKERLKRMAAVIAASQTESIMQGKLAASYWLGLIQYDVGEFDAAYDYFSVRTLQIGSMVFWTPGAHYNIARTLEALGHRQEAIEKYESIELLRRNPGNLLRAHWLKELDGGKDKKAEDKKIEEKEPKKIEEKKTVEKKIEEKTPTAEKVVEKASDQG